MRLVWTRRMYSASQGAERRRSAVQSTTWNGEALSIDSETDGFVLREPYVLDERGGFRGPVDVVVRNGWIAEVAQLVVLGHVSSSVAP